MKYIKPTAILYKDMGDKNWVEVYFDDETKVWIPALADLAEILAKIGVCEDEKYGFPERNTKGAKMVSEFISEAIDLNLEHRKDIDKLCAKYGIPAKGNSDSA